jgi:hypothetical protein
VRRREVAADRPAGYGRAHIRPVVRSTGRLPASTDRWMAASAGVAHSQPDRHHEEPAMTDHADKARRFLELHRSEHPLLLPNPWDRGSALLLASLGFQALATTSSGHAATLGRLDGSVSRDEAVAHAASIVHAKV